MKSLVIKMYKEIENIIVRTLSPFEYEKLEELLKVYTEEQIVDVYKQYGDKPISYIQKVIKNKKNTPEWLYREIVNDPIDKETENIFNDFQTFLGEFRGN